MILLSASQIETFDACERKWAFRSIAKIETPQAASAALGTEVDDEQLQPFLREGRPLDFSRPSGAIAQSIVRYLPPAGSCPEDEFGRPLGLGKVQHRIEFPSPSYADGRHADFGYQGFVDLWLPKGGLPGLEGDGAPVVSDFKTTGDLKWAKTEKALATSDVQSITYAFWALYETREPEVDLAWLYMRTKGARQGKPVYVRVHRDEIVPRFLEIDRRAQRVAALHRTKPEPLSLAPNPEHCDAYGGCPYRSICNLSPGEQADAAAAKARSRRGETEMSNTNDLLAALKARQAAANGGAAAPPPAPAAPPPAAAAPPPVVAVVGINPPEKDLPPAPAVEKRGPGRPKGSKNEPAAEASGEIGRVTWGLEKYSPVAYNAFDVGPFERAVIALPGETAAQAFERTAAELAAFAEGERAKKAISNRAFMDTVGIGTR